MFELEGPGSTGFELSPITSGDDEDLESNDSGSKIAVSGNRAISRFPGQQAQTGFEHSLITSTD